MLTTAFNSVLDNVLSTHYHPQNIVGGQCMMPDDRWPQQRKPQILHQFVRSALLAFCALAMAAPLPAQVTGTISGYVKDPSGAFALGAKVTATQTQRSISTSTQTNNEGFYNFVALDPGPYTISVEQPGFQTYVR